MRDQPSLSWPAADLSRIPFAVYHDPAIYEEEQDRIFRGPTWNYLALEAELPNAGDFLTTKVGETPVVVNRDADGALHAFINRCMHRGMLLCRERQGNSANHICPYHQWTYDLKGQLRAIPFARGVDGHGGLPKDFDLKKIRLQGLKIGMLQQAAHLLADCVVDGSDEFQLPGIGGRFDVRCDDFLDHLVDQPRPR